MSSAVSRAILHRTAHYNDEPQDYMVRYGECYGIYKKAVVKVYNFAINQSGVVCEVRSITPSTPNKEAHASSQIYGYEVTDEELQFPVPRLGFINMEKSCIYLQRTHLKRGNGRYRRGFRPDTISGFDPFLKEFKAIGEKSLLLDSSAPEASMSDTSFMNICKYVFFPEPFQSFEETLQEVLSFNRLGMAFTPTLCIKLDLNTNRFVLMKNIWTIGDYNQKTGVFDMRINTFNQELTRLSIPYKVA